MEPGFRIEQPLSVWDKPLGINLRDCFVNLGTAVAKGVASDWVGTAVSMVTALKTVKVNDTPEQTAWLLIRCSLTTAIFSLVQDYKTRFERRKDLEESALLERIDLALGDHNIVIDQGFFIKPGELSLLTQIQSPLAIWLEGYGLECAQANSISKRLSSYFVLSLNKEWRDDPHRYQCITAAVDTPFTKAGRREQAWFHYRAVLRQAMNEPMFNESFGLAQVYVAPRAWYGKKPVRKRETEAGQLIEENYRERVVVDLAEHLQAWLNQGDASDCLRLISGGPGSGKSSFCKYLAAQLARDEARRLLYVPLHRFLMNDNLINAMAEFIRFYPYFDHNPLDPKPEVGETQLLILFDGLDELAMQGNTGLETAKRFLSEVKINLQSFNQAGVRLQVILSGRQLVVDEQDVVLRGPGCILHMLPYYVHRELPFEDPQNLLASDQRQEWWRVYGQASGKNYEGLPETLAAECFWEITREPLLNYLLALSYGRGKVDFGENTNLNLIYADLLEAVFERKWEKNKYKPIEGLEQNSFVHILEEIALAVRHGDGRTASLACIEKHCESQHLTKMLTDFKKVAQEGITSLLAAFYFRQAGKSEDGHQTFEFTHKSFGEYLVARRLVRGLVLIDKQLKRRKRDYESGWDEKKALENWARLCGPLTVDIYLLSFIRDEIDTYSEKVVLSWQKNIGFLIEHILCTGMPMEKLEITRFSEMERQSRNAEAGLFMVRDACARKTKTVSNIKWPYSTSLGCWLNEMRGQPSGDLHPCNLCLSFLDMSAQLLYVQNFPGSNFEHSDLRSTKLNFSYMQGANLSGADFQEACMNRAVLKDAILCNADLRTADLGGANLSRANLNGANLNGANLSGADLSGANLSGANLSGANLSGANLVDAEMRGAILQGAFLPGTNLTRINLDDVDLRNVDLSSVQGLSKETIAGILERWPKHKLLPNLEYDYFTLVQDVEHPSMIRS